MENLAVGARNFGKGRGMKKVFLFFILCFFAGCSGRVVETDSKGNTSIISHYKNNKLDGKYSVFYEESSQLKIEGYYKDA